jgi:hypothetical protein
VKTAGAVVALPVRVVDGWKVGDMVRIEEGRGTIFSFSPLGGFAVVKVLLTQQKVTVRVSALRSGALS